MVMLFNEPLAPWELQWDGGDHIDLITVDLFNCLKSGTVLMSIRGNVVEVGKDEIDLDTRFGFLAFGFPCSTLHDPPFGVYHKDIEIR